MFGIERMVEKLGMSELLILSITADILSAINYGA